MRFYLMHREVPAAIVEVAEKTGDIIELCEILAAEHMPCGARSMDSTFDILSLRRWWQGRGIPASRSGLREALQALAVGYPEMLLLKCNGFSLSDQYWLTACDKPLDWHKVNFFENDFSDDVGRALFGEAVVSESADLCSPCNTSNGYLQKRWRIADGKRILLKAGSGVYKQEPYNEVVASRLFERLGISHVPYWLVEQGGQTLSACACFCDEHTEFVSAADILRALPQKAGTSTWEHYKRCCEMLEIPDAVPFTANLLAADYILANTDRHFGNFGALRDSRTLEWLGMAPAFDSGTSLWQLTLTHAIDANAMVPAQPFETSQAAQIKLVAPYVTIQTNALNGFGEECAAILGRNPNFDAERAEKIGNAVERHGDVLRRCD